ncbi:hypothetical protein BGX28_004527 [Mortierella sp. GBA30]|nr:hypothetical protein BGX28_004527 [Mortierella sp. GBA30]
MVHKYNFDTHTYFDVKILPEAKDQVLASTQTGIQSEGGSLAGVEYLGHVGELDNHILYRVPKHLIPARMTNAHGLGDDELEEQRNKHIADTISAIGGVLHVDIQTLRQRVKRDEL